MSLFKPPTLGYARKVVRYFEFRRPRHPETVLNSLPNQQGTTTLSGPEHGPPFLGLNYTLACTVGSDHGLRKFLSTMLEKHLSLSRVSCGWTAGSGWWSISHKFRHDRAQASPTNIVHSDTWVVSRGLVHV